MCFPTNQFHDWVREESLNRICAVNLSIPSKMKESNARD